MDKRNEFCDEAILTVAGLIHASNCACLCGGCEAPKPVIAVAKATAVGSQIFDGVRGSKPVGLNPTEFWHHTQLVSYAVIVIVSFNQVQVEYKEARSSRNDLIVLMEVRDRS